MVNPKIVTIIRALRDAFKQLEGLKYITQYIDPEVGCKDYPAVAIFCDNEREQNQQGRMEAKLTLRVYTTGSDPEWGQEALQLMVHKIVRCINRLGRNVGAGGRFDLGPINYGIIQPKDGKPIFRADIQYTVQYTDIQTEED